MANITGLYIHGIIETLRPFVKLQIILLFFKSVAEIRLRFKVNYQFEPVDEDKIFPRPIPQRRSLTNYPNFESGGEGGRGRGARGGGEFFAVGTHAVNNISGSIPFETLDGPAV